MYEVISTGKNSCYGNKNEKIKIADGHILNAIRNEWIKPETLKWIRGNWNIGEGLKEKKVAIMPEKKVYIINEIKTQTRALIRIGEELKSIKKRGDKIFNLLK